MGAFKAYDIEPTENDPKPVQWLRWARGLVIAFGTGLRRANLGECS
jgi:hypothetical protein